MRRWASALLLAAAAVLAGCGSEAGTEEEPEPVAEATTLTVASSAVGDIVTDGAGMSLYLFTQDSPGTSVCTGDCLEAWPALEGEPSAGEGIDESLLGTIEREDGSTQATYADWPLYYFAQDSAT